MKPCNFPARKLMRKLSIEGRSLRFVSDDHKQSFADHWHDSVDAARAIRTKKNRSGRAQ